MKIKKILAAMVMGATLACATGAMAKKCEQGSHDSIAYIQKRYPNCTQCRTEDIKAGACAKVKGAHKHYYCMCDKCDSTPKCAKNKWKSNGKCTACPVDAECDGDTFSCKTGFKKSGNKCVAKKCEQGSHKSIDYIKKHHPNCTQCRTENIKAGACAKVKGAHKHYYCMCDKCDSDNANSNSNKANSNSNKPNSNDAARQACQVQCIRFMGKNSSSYANCLHSCSNTTPSPSSNKSNSNEAARQACMAKCAGVMLNRSRFRSCMLSCK